MNNNLKMYDKNGEIVLEYTDDLSIYKWLAEVYIARARGSKDIARIEYHEKYDGMYHITLRVSNGLRVEAQIKR